MHGWMMCLYCDSRCKFYITYQLISSEKFGSIWKSFKFLPLLLMICAKHNEGIILKIKKTRFSLKTCLFLGLLNGSPLGLKVTVLRGFRTSVDWKTNQERPPMLLHFAHQLISSQMMRMVCWKERSYLLALKAVHFRKILDGTASLHREII